LAEVARLVWLERGSLEPTLAAGQRRLEGKLEKVAGALERVRRLRSSRPDFPKASARDPGDPHVLSPRPRVAFHLPWPWDGEWFELSEVAPLTYLTGPLGSGKTRLARRLAASLDGSIFLELDRSQDAGEAARTRMAADEALRSRVNDSLASLLEEGAAPSAALLVLLVALEDEAAGALVIDMVEQGLDPATQRALVRRMRRGGREARPLVLMTRSSVILDLSQVSTREAIIYCPANHGPPMHVAPRPGAPGYEALVNCLAAPEVRARTEGMRAGTPGPA
jgi:hypothetical protein